MIRWDGSGPENSPVPLTHGLQNFESGSAPGPKGPTVEEPKLPVPAGPNHQILLNKETRRLWAVLVLVLEDPSCRPTCRTSRGAEPDVEFFGVLVDDALNPAAAEQNRVVRNQETLPRRAEDRQEVRSRSHTHEGRGFI